MKLVIQSDNGSEVLTYEYHDILKHIEETLGEDVAREVNKLAEQLKQKTRSV